jgi:general secretion pathway protein K
MVLAVGMALVVPMYSEYVLFLKRTGNSFLREQAYAYLRGGEDLATILLRLDREQDLQAGQNRDDLTEMWAQQVTPYPLDEGGWLTGSLRDLQGLFDINSVAGPQPQGRRFTVHQEMFIRLLQASSEEPMDEQLAISITQSVIDWMDADNLPGTLGAEDDYYYDARPPYRAANREMSSVSELRAVANVTPEIYLAVEPYLTVWSDPGRINIHTAPAAVLRALNSPGNLEPLTAGEGEALLEMRGEGGFENVQALLETPVFAGLELSEEQRAMLTESSDYFLFDGQVEVADRTARLYSVLRRKGGRVDVLARGSGSL